MHSHEYFHFVLDDCRGPTVFECQNGICLEELYHCNGVNNCGDLSDERSDECRTISKSVITAKLTRTLFFEIHS